MIQLKLRLFAWDSSYERTEWRCICVKTANIDDAVYAFKLLLSVASSENYIKSFI